MKYVLAFVSPDRMDALVEELAEHHVHGLSASEAHGFGQEHDANHPEHRDHAGVDLVRKMRIEIVCRDEEVEDLLAAFYKAAHTGRRGDGKVFVLEVVDALRLKTGERGDSAIGPLTA
jgi:nitrogen regulatory protein P-II 1